MTVCYTFRLIFYRLSGGFNLISLRNIRDESSVIVNPMLFLRRGAVIGGAVLSWIIFPEMYIICIRVFIKLLVLIVSLIGGLIGYMINLINLDYKLNSLSLYGMVVFVGSM